MVVSVIALGAPVVKIIGVREGISAVIDFIDALKCILLSTSDLVGLASGSYFTSAAARHLLVLRLAVKAVYW